METPRHAELKREALRFLLAHGCAAAAVEVRCPSSRYRADAAGYLDSRAPAAGEVERAGTLWNPAGSGGAAARRVRSEARTVVIECKQSRADFLRDTAAADALLAERDRLVAEQARVERELIPLYEPHLRRAGEYLFGELEEWEFERSKLAAYRNVVRGLRAVTEALYGETKFFLMAQYRVADRLYLLAPPGVIVPRELPTGWGLLEHRRRGARGESLTNVRVVTEARPLSARADVRARMLRNIAVAATRPVRAELGMGDEPEPPALSNSSQETAENHASHRSSTGSPPPDTCQKTG